MSHIALPGLLAAVVFGGVQRAAAQNCGIRPDLPADTARRILAACVAEPGLDRERPRRESDLFRWLGRAHYPAKLADFVSTEVALDRPGVYEANPLMTNRGVRIATLAALPVVANRATSKLYHDGHERWAIFLRVVAIAVPSALAVNNLRQ